MKAQRDIWVITSHREGTFEPETYGLITEARRLASQQGTKDIVTAVVLGTGIESVLNLPGAHGADKILHIADDSLNHYNGELFSFILADMIKKYDPAYIFMSQGPDSSDLAPRLGAQIEIPVITRAMDFIIEDKSASAVRPVSNGYLFERLDINAEKCIVCFLPSVLITDEPDTNRKTEIIKEIPDINSYNLKTKLTGIIEADPEVLNIEEADIVVSAGRGAGKGEAFNVIHELARAIGGSVGATRPVIDWQLLPFERQIGQTGKTVAPRLLFACGISGANEYTAGMEKSRFVIAINNDARARIFRFADLGVVGDLHEVLPELVEQIRKEMQS